MSYPPQGRELACQILTNKDHLLLATHGSIDGVLYTCTIEQPSTTVGENNLILQPHDIDIPTA